MDDFKFAFRQVLKHPGFVSVAVLTLALGIGANTAMFSLINAVLFRPLPYPSPTQLVGLWERSPARGIEQERVSGPNFLDWRAQNSAFSDMAVSPGWDGVENFNLVLPDGIAKVRATYTSASLFSTLGTPPLLGRTLLPDEDKKEGPRVTVLGYGLWQRHFGGDSNVLGQTVILDTYGRRDYKIVGVMPPGFGQPGRAELWLPLGWMGVTLTERRSAHWHVVIARLKSGVSRTQAQAEMNAIQSRLKQVYPSEIIGSEVAIVPLLDQALGSNVRKALLVLWGVVAGVLLIASANVANLMLARAATRHREIAVRVALGAGRWRILRQLLAESLLIAALGGALGLLLGCWGLKLLIALSPANIPRLEQVTVDSTVLLFTVGVALATGVLFGLAPAWHCSRPDLNEALKEGVRGVSAGPGASRTRSVFVVAEVALSVVLLAAAGLMLQSFARILRADRGFQPEHLLTMTLDFSVSGFTTWIRPTATRPQVPLRELIERLRAKPGIQFVGASSRLLRQENRPPTELISIFGQPALRPEDQAKAEFKGITPGWVQALGGRLLRGRDFLESDTLEAPGVVLVNETLARRYFPDQDPVGQHLKMGISQPDLNATNRFGQSEWSTIVGVVSDQKSLQPQPEAVPEVYVSYWQFPMQGPTVLIRAMGSPGMLADIARREVKAVLPNLPSPSIRTMNEVLAGALAQSHLQARLLSLFAGLALLLAAVGLYGVLAYSVTQRQREIGVRMALGAQRSDVVFLVVSQGMKLALAGLGLGVVVALAVTRVMQSLIYEITPSDPATYLAVALILAVVALLACCLPARRATRIDPMEALRYE